MAFTPEWKFNIDVVDPASGVVNITAIRHGARVHSFTKEGVTLETYAKPGAAAIKAGLADDFRALYEAEVAKEAAVAALRADWERELAKALDAQEK